ncbi:DJ-1/PfpI family protein [Pedobacter sp. AJM]|uniref:DJ-1/PfpI family protein n=1 Tax=Pedobacter sp. AJM TaxID=2003629 RepID=UPI000B4BCFD7|nr:DJ-1/PfpI family protein [Pedobacter sp. AJM]OWK68823.1 thiamine biosynthesis protein ThiJ [Pedobacter sp. AJM]
MKKLLLLPFLLCCAFAFGQQDAASVKKLNVALFIYPGVGLGDLNGPADVFLKAAGLTKGQYNVYTFALQQGTIRTQGNGLQLTADYLESKMPKPDILVIPGGSIGLMDMMCLDQKVIGMLKKYQKQVDVMMSVCTASYLFGKAGILDHHKATTHYFVADDFQTQYPALTLVKDVRYVDEGKVMTCSGVTSGMDGALHLIKKYSGDSMAAMLSRAIQYTPREEEKWPVAPNGMKFDRNWKKKQNQIKQ